MPSYIVTEQAQRPADPDGRCYYCKQPIGSSHLSTCVLMKKTVKVRMTIEYDTDVPACWNADDVQFWLNESSFCVNDVLDELQANNDQACLCGRTKLEFVQQISHKLFLKEQ
jgi:hypothetical protein